MSENIKETAEKAPKHEGNEAATTESSITSPFHEELASSRSASRELPTLNQQSNDVPGTNARLGLPEVCIGNDRILEVPGHAGQANERTQENKEPWQISKDIVDAVKNGQPLDQVQKDIGNYIQRLMSSGMSEFEMRKWVGQLSNELFASKTGLTDSQGQPMDLAIRLGGDGKDKFTVYMLANEMTNKETQLGKFDVNRAEAAENPQDKTAENKEPWQIAKDLAETLKNGGSVEQFQKDIGAYLQKMMDAGLSEFDMRTMVGHIGEALRRELKGARDASGNKLDVSIMMSGDGKEGFTVHLIQDVFTKKEQELNRFYVNRK